MAFIPNLRTKDKNGKIVPPHFYGRKEYPKSTVDAAPQSFVDTPEIIYSDWPKKCGGTLTSQLGVATDSETSSIGVIGGGIAGCTAAFELIKAGFSVTLFEASDEVGGRTKSVGFDGSQDIAEMGAMRFPPSEDLLYYYSKLFGYSFG